MFVANVGPPRVTAGGLRVSDEVRVETARWLEGGAFDEFGGPGDVDDRGNDVVMRAWWR